MSFINVAEWTPRHVVQWLQGLEDCIQPYVNFFLNSDNPINGCRLLLLDYDDLEKLHINKIGHQEIILDSVDLLKHLHYSFASETLQTLALKLGCKSRSLYNHLKKEANCSKCVNCLEKLNSPQKSDYDENEENKLIYSNLFPQYKKSNVVIKPMPIKKMCRKITTFTLYSVCDILVSVKQFISWIDRYSFERQVDHCTLIRQTILRISIELASTAQRDHFVENPKEIIKNNCLKFAEICDRIVQEFNDSLAIQPACLEMVPILRKEDEELGIQIHSSYNGIHLIGAVKIQSPAHRCGRIEEGDEIVQINYQTVVGWTQTKLIEAMKEEFSTKILITIKKRPSHARIAGQLKVLEPTKIPNRQLCTKSVNCQLQEIAFNQQDNYVNNLLAVNSYRNSSTNLLNTEFVACKHEHDSHIYGNINSTASISQSTICIQNHENKECCEQNTNNHKKLIEQMSQEKPMKGPVYQMSNKPKKLKRRATISGSIIGQSPTTLHPPIRIEDLVNLNNTENYYLNKNKSVKTSHLNMQDAALAAQETTAGPTNLYKSFNSLSTTDCLLLDDQLDSIIKCKPSLSKRTCSEDDSQFKKRTVSVCYNEVYGVNNEFFKQNYLTLPKQHLNGDKATTEEFNQSNEMSGSSTDANSMNSMNEDYCFRNKNNATVIKVNATRSLPFVKVNNSSSSEFENFDQVNENYFNQDKLNSIEVTGDNKNILHVLGSPSDENNELMTDPTAAKDKTTVKSTFKLMPEPKLNSQNQSQSKQINYGILTARTNQLENEDLKIDTHCSKYSLNKDTASVMQKQSIKEHCTETKQEHLKPEVLKRKLNKPAKLIKNLNCYQLRNNSDHKGWLNYLREELNEISKKSSPNFKLTKNEHLKWKENYLILKHDLLYFYLNDEDEQQPCRIINLPSFDLDDDLDYRTGMHVFKIRSSKYAFSFASKDLNLLNEWINKFKMIFSLKNNKDLDKSTVNQATSKSTVMNSKSTTNQYHSFNSNHSSYVQNGQANQFRLTHSVKDLNFDENLMNDKMKYLNDLMSKSSNQIVLANNNEKMNNNVQKFDKDEQIYRLGTKYFANGSYSRSQSCVDSNFVNKFTRARLMNKEIRANQLSNQSINQLPTDNSFLPPSSFIKSPQIAPRQIKKSHQSINDFYLDQQVKYSTNYADSFDDSLFNQHDQFSKQNLINQLNEQNQLNSQQEQDLIQKKEIPKPQPRISKMKEQNNANFVGKIISEFDELSKVCQKELEHYSSLRKRSNCNILNNRTVNEMNKINSNFNSYPRNLTSTVKKEASNKEATHNLDNEVKPIKSFKLSNDNPESKYVSVLDREYNRLFNKNPPTIKTATSKEIQSIYLKQYDSESKIQTHNLNSPTSNSISNALINADKLREHCNSPISDHSLSSSSGISSYYSMGQQDVQTVKYLSNLSTELDAYSSTSTNNFSFSPNSKNSSLDHQTNSDQCDMKLKAANDLADTEKKQSIKSNEKNAKKEDKKSVQRKSSFNSFRIFGSSKVLSKLSSSKSEDEKVTNKSKSFLTSPRLKRSFFGHKRKNSLPTSTSSTAVQTEDQLTNQLNNQVNNQLNNLNKLTNTDNLNSPNSVNQLNDHHLNRMKSKSSELLNNQLNNYMDQLNQKNKLDTKLLDTKLLDNKFFDNFLQQNQPQTPETLRKPTMGLTMLTKRRSSSVSCDKVAIESAFQM